MVNDTDIDIIAQLVEEIEMQQRHKDEAQKKMTSLCEVWFPKELENLQTIPGVKEQVAIARKMLVAVWYILHDGVPYIKPSDHYSAAIIAAES